MPLEKKKPRCKLIGENGNVYNLIGIVRRTLQDNGFEDQAKELMSRVYGMGSYDEVLMLFQEYVEIE